jgi:hypothetical protein
MIRAQYSRLNRDPQHGSYWSLDTADLQRSEFIVQDTPTPGESSAAPADSNSEPHRDTVQGDPEEEDAEAVRRRSFFHWQARFRMMHFILKLVLGSSAKSAKTRFRTVGVTFALSVLKPELTTR